MNARRIVPIALVAALAAVPAASAAFTVRESPLSPAQRDAMTPSVWRKGCPVSLDQLRAVRGADKANIVAARVFDDFRGQGVPEGQRSLAIEVTLQPVEKSYDEAALKAIADRIVAAVAKLGGTLRG